LQIKSGAKEFASASEDQRHGIGLDYLDQQTVQVLQQGQGEDVGLVGGTRHGNDGDISDSFQLNLMLDRIGNGN
jgi:hypothetical protein